MKTTDIQTAMESGKHTAAEPGKQQPSRIKKIVLVFFIMLIQTFTLFSTDMFIPALPLMATNFSTSDFMVNLSLVVFFAFTPVGVLIFGALSDKYGRKPILYIGTLAFIVESIICAFAATIWIFIVARAFQALAAGAASVVGTALVKDLFSGKTRENVLICVQVTYVVGPILAPVMGAQILRFFSWRATFIALALLGLLSFVMTLFFKEPLVPEQRLTGSALRSLTRLGVVLKQRNFVVFLTAVTLFTSMPFLTYLSVSPYIYEGFFGLSAQTYSYFFAATAFGSVLGVLLYKPLTKVVSLKTITTGLITLSGLSGIGLFFFGRYSPFIFFVFILLYYITNTLVRPYSTNALLESQDTDIGSASALITCSFNVFGILGVLIIMPLGTDDIFNLSTLIILSALISGLVWVYFLRSSLIIKGIKDR